MNATEHAIIEAFFNEISPSELANLIEDTQEKYAQYALRDKAREGCMSDIADQLYYLKRLSQTLRKVNHSNVKRAC